MNLYFTKFCNKYTPKLSEVSYIPKLLLTRYVEELTFNFDLWTTSLFCSESKACQIQFVTFFSNEDIFHQSRSHITFWITNIFFQKFKKWTRRAPLSCSVFKLTTRDEGEEARYQVKGSRWSGTTHNIRQGCHFLKYSNIVFYF